MDADRTRRGAGGPASGALAFAVLLAGLAVLLVLAPHAALAACPGAKLAFFVYGHCKAESVMRPVEAPAAAETAAPVAQPAAAWEPARGMGRLLFLHAQGILRDGRGGTVANGARMTVRCRDGNTSLYFTFPGREMGNRGAAREFVYSLDGGGEEILELERGKDHAIMGVWQGYRAVPLLRRLIKAGTLEFSAISGDGSPLAAKFDIAGLDRAIAPVRAACSW